MVSKYPVLILTAILTALLLSACGSVYDSAAPVAVEKETSASGLDAAGQEDAGTETQAAEEPSAVAEPVEEPQQASAGFVPKPAARQPVQIVSSGNRMLEGWYYPARVDNAPVVVLMHWAKGTMEDWQSIAAWLQNRLDEVPAPKPGAEAYDDISWFPPMPDEISYAVLVFNFGNFGSSPFGGDRESWVWDAIGALNFAAGLEDVDAHRISAMGASIGADGPVDSCYLFNDAGEIGTCIGALSLSPGNYLTENFTYPEAASFMELQGYPVWCLAAEGDYESPALCSVLTGEHARSFIYSGKDHGMDLVTQNHFPQEPALPEINTMMIIQEWLEVTYGLPHNEYSIP